MAYPNLLTYKGNGLVQYVSNNQFTALAEVVLEYMVSENGVGVLTTNTSFTSIGTFTDNYIVGEIGSSDTTLTFADKQFYQNLDANTVGAITATPIEWNVARNAVKQLDNDALNNLADEVISHLVTNDGPGTYYLGTSAPVDGGTWSQAFSIVDKVSTGTDYSPISYVWVKTSGTTSLSDSVLKLEGSNLKYMSSAEIQSLAATVRQRIIDTEIGTYALTESSPVTGTWEAKGTIVDRYYTVSDVIFTGANDVGYIGTVAANYQRQAYTGILRYFGPGPAFFFGNIDSGPDGPSFGQGYQGIGTSVLYAGPPATFFGPVRYYTGVTSATFTGTVSVDYAGPQVANTYTISETLTLWRRIS